MANILISKEDFKEEKERLHALILTIQKIIDNYHDYQPIKGITKYTIGDDYDDVDSLRIDKTVNERYYLNEIEPWKLQIESPYYGRIDVTIDGVSKTFYIGERDLWENGKLVVNSGLSDIGAFYNQTTLGTTYVKGHDYNALLRRRLLIENREIVFADDTFVLGSDPKYKGITDPYLALVLKRNRNKTQMASILSSIQENQFSIVRQDVNNSFVVQGCAGSGKTAILFHRLSNIQYHDNNYIDSKVRIISPNDGFTEYVKEYSHNLGLRNINPQTLDSYYFELLKRYNFEPSYKTVESDSEINNDFINTIYSDQFTINLTKACSSFIESIRKPLDFDTLREKVNTVGIVIKDEYIYNLQALESFLNKVQTYIDNVLKTNYKPIKNKVEKCAATINDYCTKLSIEIPKTITEMDNIKNLIKSSLFNTITQFNEALDNEDNFYNGKKVWMSNPPSETEVQDYIRKLNDYIQYNSNKIESIEKEISSLEFEISKLDVSIDQKWMKKVYPELLKEKEELLSADTDAGFLSFIRKNRINNRIKEIDYEISQHLDKPKESEKKKQEYLGYIDELKRKLNSINESGTPDLNFDVNNAIEIANQYLSCLVLEEHFNEYELGDYLLSKENLIKSALRSSALNINTLYNNVVIPELNKLAQNFGYKTKTTSDGVDGAHHTYNLYIRLLVASMFLYKPFNKDKFICIDEAQEYSINEFILISDVNSYGDNKVVLNIYGDINQRNSIKGIQDWSQLTGLINCDYFVMKENYRNSAEIVKYTNDHLGLSDIAIGLEEGKPVKEISIEESIKLLNEGQIAVIMKENTPLYDEIYMRGIAFNNKSKSIILLTPLLAKGQEFTKVLVFDKDMDDIEKYVSYTRAKSELFICKE